MNEDYYIKQLHCSISEQEFIWIEFLLWLKQSKTKKVVERIKKIVEEQNSIENTELVEWLEALPTKLKPADN